MSQDPVFWEIGVSGDGKSIISSPQLQNSYSYASNNPIVGRDPSGRCPMCWGAAVVALEQLPRAINFLASLGTPLGQLGMDQVATDIKSGNYPMVVVGAITLGELGPGVRSGQRTADLVSGAIRSVDGNIEDGFTSFRAFKNKVGAAGQGRDWHHIVEQNSVNKANFAPQKLQNRNNLINIPRDIHQQISGHYSSSLNGPGSGTIRQWVSKQPFEKQFEYGKDILGKAVSGLLKNKNNNNAK